MRARGGPPDAIQKAGRYLAAALEVTGFRAVRATTDGPQLTL